MVRTGDRVKIDGNVYTVKGIFKVFLKETKRYRTDPNPIPAGTVVVNLSGGWAEPPSSSARQLRDRLKDQGPSGPFFLTPWQVFDIVVLRARTKGRS